MAKGAARARRHLDRFHVVRSFLGERDSRSRLCLRWSCSVHYAHIPPCPLPSHGHASAVFETQSLRCGGADGSMLHYSRTLDA